MQFRNIVCTDGLFEIRKPTVLVKLKGISTAAGQGLTRARRILRLRTQSWFELQFNSENFSPLIKYSLVLEYFNYRYKSVDCCNSLPAQSEMSIRQSTYLILFILAAAKLRYLMFRPVLYAAAHITLNPSSYLNTRALRWR